MQSTVWMLETSNNKEMILYAETLSKASLSNLKCAVCDSYYRVEMHHVRMKDLNPKPEAPAGESQLHPRGAKLKKIDAFMAKRNRKEIPLCRTCHLAYHHKGDEKES